MQALALTRSEVLRSADVTAAAEKARQRRLRRLALLLALIAVPLGARALIGSVRYARGDLKGAASAFRWPIPHLPAGAGTYIPSMVLIVVLTGVLVVPLLAAGRSPHVLYRPEEVGTRLADVVGAGPVVEEVVKTLNLFLAYRTFHETMGGTPRRAVLFEGPPGTGKTYLAKAMAAEAGVPFLFVSSSAFQSMFYGQTNRKIRAYFKALRAHARSEGGAIGFIEEIDAIGATRGGMGPGGGREGIAGVVNELLIQLQSFDQPTTGARMRGALVDLINIWLPAHRRLRKPAPSAANILVIGATNRAGDLDPALLRPGRFDRIITVDLPSRAGRREIIDYYLARKAHTGDLDDPAQRDSLAATTYGYSPVMLEHLLDEALIWALRRGADRLNWGDIQKAKMGTELGLAQPVEYAERERRTIATHEAGHATVAWLMAPGRTLEVLSIIKRKSSLGLLAHSDSEERFTRNALGDRHPDPRGHGRSRRRGALLRGDQQRGGGRPPVRHGSGGPDGRQLRDGRLADLAGSGARPGRAQYRGQGPVRRDLPGRGGPDPRDGAPGRAVAPPGARLSGGGPPGRAPRTGRAHRRGDLDRARGGGGGGGAPGDGGRLAVQREVPYASPI